MSIKAKLSFSISIIVAIILVLNMMFSHISSKLAQQNDLNVQMQSIANQMVATIETIEKTRASLDKELGEKLRIAAIAVRDRLDSNIDNVSAEQLVSLTRELNLDDITLWQRIDGKVVSINSSNPDEIGLRSESWDYWDTAFHQLFDRTPVTVPRGDTWDNYWSGPINYASSNPSQINKWGYYYDGTTNYMINTIVNTNSNFAFDLVNGINGVIDKMLRQQPMIFEVTGFNPEYFGSKPIIKMKKGVPVYNLDVRDISFGTYLYKNTAEDVVHIHNALRSGDMESSRFVLNGNRVLRSFVPIHTDKPYVIGVAFDERALQEPLQRQLMVHSFISLGLVIITMFASYFIAGYMLRSLNRIILKVNAIAAGNFDFSISIRGKDELGMLAARVNTMGNNLLKYTTQLKNTARELQSTKQYLESFVNHTSDAIHVVDLDDNIIRVNNAFEAMYGWREEEVLGGPLPTIPEEHQAAFKDLIDVVAGGGSVTGYETVRYTKAGEALDISMTISGIRDEREQIIAIASISRNITSRKQAEEMIRRSEKLSVVGQLAAGVAHEVRNPLTTLRGFVQLHKRTGSLSPTNLDLMLAELDQINMIVSEFLVLAKPQANRYNDLDPKQLICDIVMLMESEAKLYNIELSVRSEGDIPLVRGVSYQLKQVFVNIIKNGMEAMTEGGQLAIELKHSGSGEVAIRFIDQGCGISSDDLSRIGEPFFTKKPDGNGLGIMICQQIIDKHNGSITFSSEVGIGTCVEILLPARTEELG